ncbi:MAG: DUF433 domain-containing protein [Gemmatimonadetes bacterium]|nr:DUF433 domain-containing protein [Gemmatimonadota bacterium]MYF74665.1 DUF433 domain-containing protein [Gemmatimonadota bacterium]MYK52297.1 DUF433 domain-containing protein [Gemmatimonadota bacterium]
MNKAYVEWRDEGYWIVNTRVSLDTIVYAFLDGQSPESIAQSLPALTLEQIYGAIAFYLAHQPEVETYLEKAKTDFETKRKAARKSDPVFYQKLADARCRVETIPIIWSHIESRLNSSLPKWEEHIENFDQVAAIEERIAGKTWNDDEVFEGLLMAVLSSGIDWSKIEKIRHELKDVFCGFSLEEYAALPDTKIASYVVPWFKERKAGSPWLKRNLINLTHTARKLAEYSKTYGAAERYFTSLMYQCDDDPKQVALCIGLSNKYKLPSFGVPVAAEALKNLGFDVAKPDRHILRAMGSFGLVHFNRWPDRSKNKPPTTPTRSELYETMASVEKIAVNAGKYVGFVDNAIWLLCAMSGLDLTNKELTVIAYKAHSKGCAN